jgi:DNA (cytosine-5)-methyltransferase 1
MNVLDLFSGIGGFSLGLERAGMETAAFCEFDLHARTILREHWPNVPIYEDVREVNIGRLQSDGIVGIDIITGGFPCQDLSSAGKRSGIYGSRSGLWGELFRIMCEIRPKYTVFENVAGLLTGESGRWFDRLLCDMAEGGFILEWECIPASSIGAPHHRDRVYGVAYPSEVGWRGIFSKADLAVKRDMGEHQRVDWFGSGAGSWANWQGETRQEIFSQPLIARKNDGFSSWVDRNSRLGNAVVPEIPERIGRAIMAIEQGNMSQQ